MLCAYMSAKIKLVILGDTCNFAKTSSSASGILGSSHLFNFSANCCPTLEFNFKPMKGYSKATMRLKLYFGLDDLNIYFTNFVMICEGSER